MLIDNAGVICRAQSACASCGQPGITVHAGLRDHIFAAEGEWAFRRCTNPRCALLWLDPMPLPAEIGKFYASYYTHAPHRAPDGGGVGPGVQWKSLAKKLLARLLFWRRHAYLSRLAYLEGLPPGRLLEVGCGNGSFLRAASAAGWKAFGVDFDPNAVAAAQTIPGVQAAVGDIYSANLQGGEFDAVVMNNVIEHLPTPQRVFEECRRVLKPGGRLVMITPNAQSLGHRRYQQDWRGLEVPRHLYIFSPATLASFARNARFARISAFSSAGGATGVECLVFSQVLRAKRLRQPEAKDPRLARRTIAMEVASILVGWDVGEWAVLVAHK